MRTSSVEETTEANRVAAESARPGPIRTPARVTPRRAVLPSEPRFTAALAELGRLFAASAPADLARDDRFARAAVLLVEATGAERVAIYRPGDAPLAFVVAASASLTATLTAAPKSTGPAGAIASGACPVEPAARLELSPTHASARRLLAGRSARVVRPLSLRRPSVATRFAAAPGWARVDATLQVPCPGGEGLNGVVCFEGGLFESVQSGVAEIVSARAEAAVALVAAGLERERLERALDSMRVERARSERLALLGRAAGGAAHDLNNVLTAILGYADLLELELPGAGAGVDVGVRGALAGEAERRMERGPVELDEIRAAVARGAALVEELLAFGRSRTAVAEAVDLAEVLEGLVGIGQRVAGEAIGLALRVEPGLARVRVEREALERAVLNLIANARHAIEARAAGRGRIAIALEPIRDDAAGSTPTAAAAGTPAPAGGWVRLSLTDDGCGMTPEVAGRIFEPFFTTRAASGGTGLGLAGVADFVRASGGRIAVESTPGHGTTIRIELPTAPTPPTA